MDDHAPVNCPYGHELGPEWTLVGWSPCQCPPALTNHRGHRTYQCLRCRESDRTSVCYRPYHVPEPGAVIRWP